jgi:hypothetical protein
MARLYGMFGTALLCLVLVNGCTDDTGSVGMPATNNMRVDPPAEVPQNSKLVHLEPCVSTQATCAVDLTFNSGGQLRVKLLNGSGDAVANASVTFDLDPREAQGTRLDASSAVTDASGIATLQIQAGQQEGVADVTVSTSNNTVTPINFLIGVSPKDAASYRVTFTHNGAADLKQIKVYLFENSVTCANVREDLARGRDDDPATSPTLTAESTSLGLALADGTLPTVIFPAIPNGRAYTVSAHAFDRMNEEVEAAFGCKDGNDAVNDGRSVDVVVPLIDNLPIVKGEYNVTHTFDLREALPENVRMIVDIIGRIATNPGSFIIGTFDGSGNSNQDGLIHVLLDFLPDGDFKDTISSFIDSGLVGPTLTDMINDLLEDFIDNNAPAWVSNTIDITGDIYETLQRFRVVGKIYINETPEIQVDASGDVVGILPADSGRQLWNEIIVYWQGDCDANAPPTCSERSLSPADLGTNASVVDGTFDGTVLQYIADGEKARGLVINQHTLSLNYGVLLLAIIERIILPSIFGQNVTSVNDALNSIIDCDDLAQSAADAIGGGNNIRNVVTSLCNSLLSEASDSIRDYMLNELTFEGENNFLLGTPDGKPCRLREPAVYSGDWIGKPLPYVEKMGEEMTECEWDVRLKFSETNIVEMDGSFHGSRAGF